ncbi:hypothetical protein [Planomicrobium okeanokoites]|uniref:hypothetical protein n=1 Tax=Planomicrobium okeanokoites TaxID=244 RepID=UPI00249095DF|nr:hypothetical protein [Planomicrobium okeanokoites]
MKQLNLSYYISFNNSSFIEKRKRPLSSERHKTNQRSGLGRTAGMAYDPKSWAAGDWTLRKAETAVKLRQA